MAKRLIQIGLLVLIGLLLAAPVYAVSVTNAVYIADIVTANAGTAATNVSTACDIN